MCTARSLAETLFFRVAFQIPIRDFVTSHFQKANPDFRFDLLTWTPDPCLHLLLQLSTAIHCLANQHAAAAYKKQAMGDFAAGKMLVNGVEISPVSVADFDQFVGDVDGNQEFINSVEGAGPSPSPAAEELLNAGLAVPEAPSELLMCLKQWRDVGLHLYVVGSSYSIRDAEAILGNAGEDLFVIGDDMDGGVLLMGRDGVLFTADPDQPAVEVGYDLGTALGVFRDYLVSKKIEWAEGWIEAA